jgi:DUF2934 family protein
MVKKRIETIKKMPVTPRAAQSTAKTDVVTHVSAEAISRRAYSLFEARGSEHGHDVEDWLVAESELVTATTKSPGPSLNLNEVSHERRRQ